MFNSLFSNLFDESHRLKKGMGVTNNQHTNINPPSNTAALFDLATCVKTNLVPLFCSHQNSWVKMDVNNPLILWY